MACMGDGPALVLLHGGSGSWNHWIHTVPVFADSYRVMAADTPGLGDSPTPNEPHTIEGVAEIVSEGIDKLIPGDAQFDIVGFSFGGLMGGQIALLQSHRVRSLTIVGSPPFGLGHINPATTSRLSIRRGRLQRLSPPIVAISSC